MTLQDVFNQYNQEGIYPFHMPGHKRNSQETGAPCNPYLQDYTEVEGLDNLYTASGKLKESMDHAAALWGSSHCLFGVNGSTGGIFTAVFAALSPGETALVARNCHKSVYNALSLRGAKAFLLSPPLDEGTGIPGSISPKDVVEALELHPEIRLVILTSPTYEGVISPVAAIAKTAHARGVPVLVDEAHGARLHFALWAGEPSFSAVDAGADLVVQSLHKTLPALTQTTLLHGQGSRIPWQRVKKYWASLQTSSPSYVLMESIDRCCHHLEASKERFLQHRQRLLAFSRKMNALSRLSILCKGKDSLENHPSFFAMDPDKIVMLTGSSSLTGQDIAQKMRREFSIQLEMASLIYALAMTSFCDTPEGFSRLETALLSMDAKAPSFSPCQKRLPPFPCGLGSTPCDFSLPERVSGERVQAEAAVGLRSLEAISPYPPGIPLLLPGEIVSREAVETLFAFQRAGLEVQSPGGLWDGRILVCS